MPLLRNIAGVSKLGLINTGNALDAMRLPSESDGGYAGYFYPVSGDPGNPIGAGGNGGGVLPPVEKPQYPMSPEEVPGPVYPPQLSDAIPTIYPSRDIITQLPVPNQVTVLPEPAGKPNWMALLTIAGLALAMTGMHPFKKIGSSALFLGGLGLLLFELSKKKNPVQPENIN